MPMICLFGEEGKFANYKNAVEGCGGQCLFSRDPADEPLCAGLILPGGGDVDPALYGRENRGSEAPDRDLDLRELAALRAFTAAGKPVLAICRGHQLVNVAFGGTLIQDLPTAADHRRDPLSGDKVHPVTAESGFLRQLYGERFWVNSSHHQGLEQIAPGFSVAALAADGVVEAMEDPARRIYCTQFHPERMCFAKRREDTVDGQAIFRFFLSLCE